MRLGLLLRFSSFFSVVCCVLYSICVISKCHAMSVLYMNVYTVLYSYFQFIFTQCTSFWIPSDSDSDCTHWECPRRPWSKSIRWNVITLLLWRDDDDRRDKQRNQQVPRCIFGKQSHRDFFFFFHSRKSFELHKTHRYFYISFVVVVCCCCWCVASSSSIKSKLWLNFESDL